MSKGDVENIKTRLPDDLWHVGFFITTAFSRNIPFIFYTVLMACPWQLEGRSPTSHGRSGCIERVHLMDVIIHQPWDLMPTKNQWLQPKILDLLFVRMFKENELIANMAIEKLHFLFL